MSQIPPKAIFPESGITPDRVAAAPSSAEPGKILFAPVTKPKIVKSHPIKPKSDPNPNPVPVVADPTVATPHLMCIDDRVFPDAFPERGVPYEGPSSGAIIDEGTRTAEAIRKYHVNGGVFDEHPDHDGRTAAMYAAYRGADSIKAFIATPGAKFTDQVDHYGLTAAMFAAMSGGRDEDLAAAIESFHAAGGRFTDQQECRSGMSAALYVANFGGPKAIKAFADAGGSFTDQYDHEGRTAAMYVVGHGAEAIKAFRAAGGTFTDRQDHSGMSAAMYVAMTDAESIIYCGAKFSFRSYKAERLISALKAALGLR